jgi:acetate kinase
MGIRIDPARNAATEEIITRDASPAKALVVPTNEELMIALRTRAVVEDALSH